MIRLLRRGVVVENRSRYPDSAVAAIVEGNMRGRPGRPATVIVRNRNLPSDTRQGFTPYDTRAPIELWIEPAYRYPEPGARSWEQELALNAAHEDYHLRHPDRLCPDGRCEIAAEAWAHREYARRR